ncbi:MAG: hypothetical protein WC132_05950, partial [Methanomethylophilus sp.]
AESDSPTADIFFRLQRIVWVCLLDGSSKAHVSSYNKDSFSADGKIAISAGVKIGETSYAAMCIGKNPHTMRHRSYLPPRASS